MRFYVKFKESITKREFNERFRNTSLEYTTETLFALRDGDEPLTAIYNVKGERRWWIDATDFRKFFRRVY
jgi:hypothetical protein